MSERLTVRIAPPNDDRESLPVEDAFAHILDLFELAKSSDEVAEREVEWRLVSVSMNSPLTVTAEAYPLRAGVDVDAAARRQKSGLARGLADLQRGRMPRVWGANAVRRNTAKDFAERSVRRIGSTRIELGPDYDTPTKAPSVIELAADSFSPDWESALATTVATVSHPAIEPKAQIGSIEGRFLEVGTNYNQPALHIQDRRTGRKVWCVVSADEQQRIAATASFSDVWEGRRLVVSGRIEYDAHGKLHRIFATKVRLIDQSEVQLESDPEFTDGKSASAYLEELREGNLG